MRIRVLVVAILGLLLGEPAAAQILPIPPGWQMERAILLSRHGVRSPTKANEEMDRNVATPWPVWPVAPGFLTPRGAELMRLMGGYYRVLYGGRGLMEASICPPRNTVAAWTDVDQRTRLTGAALLNGMQSKRSSRSLSRAPRPESTVAISMSGCASSSPSSS